MPAATSSPFALNSSWVLAPPVLERMDKAVDDSLSADYFRFPLSKNAELARVFGGGIVAGSLTVLSGTPGSGKSTLALQIAGMIAESLVDSSNRVLYISGEETFRQVRHRSQRLDLSSSLGYMDLINSGSMTQILGCIQEGKYKAIIVDSIQTMQMEEYDHEAGGVVQVRACATKFMQIAKALDIAVLMVSHVTKDGTLAGPRTLEHLVDVVLQLDNSDSLISSEVRWLSAAKNRFGPCETGVLRHGPKGFEPLGNTEMYISSNNADMNDLGVGVAWTIGTQTARGSRFVLAEIQSLVSRSGNPMGVSVKSSGVPKDRASLITTVLSKHHPDMDKLPHRDLFLNAVGNVSFDSDRGADLGIAMAISSSFFNKPCVWPKSANNRRGVAFVGELGLNGEVRTCRELPARIQVAEAMGLEAVVVPNQYLAAGNLIGAFKPKLKVIGVEHIRRCLDLFLR